MSLASANHRFVEYSVGGFHPPALTRRMIDALFSVAEGRGVSHPQGLSTLQALHRRGLIDGPPYRINEMGDLYVVMMKAAGISASELPQWEIAS